MESPFLALILLILGIFFSTFAPLVESLGNVNHDAQSSRLVPPPPPHPHPPPPPPPPHPSPPPPAPAPTSPPQSPPPHHMPFRFRPPPPQFPRRHPPPARRSPKRSAPPIPQGKRAPAAESGHGNSSTVSKQSLNLGKKLGLTFFGIAVVMQIGVVAFLVLKRRQLLKNEGLILG